MGQFSRVLLAAGLTVISVAILPILTKRKAAKQMEGITAFKAQILADTMNEPVYSSLNGSRIIPFEMPENFLPLKSKSKKLNYPSSKPDSSHPYLLP